ncbi:hypothetical protein CBR_g46301 [Chara braunii]|uniref:Uncharacterized protein n=1 Tax=Chara braunii TaxID=69332 RepID=A0A388M0C6_CHABU|nr:hypothetical protein CBR_g46301 [Chara braunii]|eukprot:GBG87933.1 hypothetical protein CBR_g46301 [Chara braunii]
MVSGRCQHKLRFPLDINVATETTHYSCNNCHVTENTSMVRHAAAVLSEPFARKNHVLMLCRIWGVGAFLGARFPPCLFRQDSNSRATFFRGLSRGGDVRNRASCNAQEPRHLISSMLLVTRW